MYVCMRLPCGDDVACLTAYRRSPTQSPLAGATPPSGGPQGEEGSRLVGMSAVAAAMRASNPEEAVATIQRNARQVIEYYKVPFAAELAIKIAYAAEMALKARRPMKRSQNGDREEPSISERAPAQKLGRTLLSIMSMRFDCRKTFIIFILNAIAIDPRVSIECKKTCKHFCDKFDRSA